MDFEQIYNTYYMQVFSYVMTLAKNQDVSEEITQKTFYKAMTTEKIHRGDSSELTWLCAIAKNLFIDEHRENNKSDELKQECASDSDFEDTLSDEESAFHVYQVLHNLDEPYKEVFQLRIFGELPFKKIGLLFGKTENWACVTYHRARFKIRERMEEK